MSNEHRLYRRHDRHHRPHAGAGHRRECMMKGLRAILYGIEPTDAITLAAVAVTLLAVATLAVAMPAVRAMRIDPVSALRSE